MKKITLFIILLTSFCGYSQNSVTVATSQAWNGYVNAFNLDDSYAFGFSDILVQQILELLPQQQV